MADVGKKTIKVDTKINLYGECKGKRPPVWFLMRPKLKALDKEVAVKRSMDLDPRKWKKKTIEDGVYAVAKYELAIIDTVIKTLEKDVAKATKTKDNAKLQEALDKAEAQILSLHKKSVKEITNKVSLALDEVESDTGNNKAALAAGKEALKRFDALDTDDMFLYPTDIVVQALEQYADALGDGGEADAARKETQRDLSLCKKQFQSTAKEAQSVVKYLLHKGDKMAKDKNADPTLQEVGKQISGGPLNASMKGLIANVEAFEKDLDAVIKLVDGGKTTAAAVQSKAKAFEKDNRGRDRAVKDAVAAVRDVAKKFSSAAKSVKK